MDGLGNGERWLTIVEGRQERPRSMTAIACCFCLSNGPELLSPPSYMCLGCFIQHSGLHTRMPSDLYSSI